MTTLTWDQMIEPTNNSLFVPEISSKMSIREAAIAYANAGWYVLPVNDKTKHAGSYVGTNWPEKSTRDPERIKSLFRSDGLAIALHVGRSGAVVFDVDNPGRVPTELAQILFEQSGPFQATRTTGDKRRGHYPFLAPRGMAFGNSTGPFNTGFGDVRGKNGIIIAAPSSHSKQDNFGLYKWQRTGQVPELPLAIALRLPQVSHESAASFNSAEVKEFLFVHSENQYPKLLRTRLEYFSANPPSINSRHTAFQRLLCLILKDAIVGMYPAETALIECQALFNLVKRPDEQTSNEFEGMACWAMAQVNMMSDDEKLMHGMSVAPHLNPEIMKWINSLDN